MQAPDTAIYVAWLYNYFVSIVFQIGEMIFITGVNVVQIEASRDALSIRARFSETYSIEARETEPVYVAGSTRFAPKVISSGWKRPSAISSRFFWFTARAMFLPVLTSVG